MSLPMLRVYASTKFLLFTFLAVLLLLLLGWPFPTARARSATKPAPPSPQQLNAVAAPDLAANPINGAREGHSATLLNNGKVLVVGGRGATGALGSAQLYDPTTGTWTATRNGLANPRYGHAAVLLRNGQVMVIGGQSSNNTFLDTFELYDPVTDNWSLPANRRLATARSRATATLLYTGRVLLTGGQNSSGFLSSTELYTVATGTWTSMGATANLNVARSEQTATLLDNGNVLVAGGLNHTGPLRSSEIFNVANYSWTRAGDLNDARRYHTATLLPNQQVLVAGGTNGSQPLPTAELFNPTSGQWVRTLGSLGTGRRSHTATLLPSGRVFVAGGRNANDAPLNLAQLYDFNTQQWSTAPLPPIQDAPPQTFMLGESRSDHTASLLANGRVLLVGGLGGNSNSFLSSVELYDYAAASWARTQTPVAPATNATVTQLQRPRKQHTATLLADGRVLVAGGVDLQQDVLTSLRSAEIYNPATGAWTVLPNSMSFERANHTATLLPNGEVLLVGGSGPGGNTAELFDPRSNSWRSAGTFTGFRTKHTATLIQRTNGGTSQYFVLVVGGENSTVNSAVVLLYNVATGAWESGRPTARRSEHSATLLPNGNVFVFGGRGASGGLNTGVIYNPNTNDWSDTRSTRFFRYGHSGTLLPNGRVLIACGYGSTGTVNNIIVSNSEIYDPSTNQWDANQISTAARASHTATLLPNGKVLLLGGVFGGAGSAGQSTNPTAQLYDPNLPAGQALTTIPNPLVARHEHSATLLLNGKVLVAGGTNLQPRAIDETLFNHAELFNPGLGYDEAWRPALTGVLSPAAGFRRAEGFNFQGLSEASGHGAQLAASNHPVAQMYSLGNGQLRYLNVDGSNGGWSDFSSAFPTVSGFAPGPALLTIYAHGIPSYSLVVSDDGSRINDGQLRGSITGRITYPNGDPVAGTLVLRAAPNSRGVCGGQRTITTAADGSYRFTDLRIFPLPVAVPTSARHVRAYNVSFGEIIDKVIEVGGAVFGNQPALFNNQFGAPPAMRRPPAPSPPEQMTCSYEIYVYAVTRRGIVHFKPDGRRFDLRTDGQPVPQPNTTDPGLFISPPCQDCSADYVSAALTGADGAQPLIIGGKILTLNGENVTDKVDLTFTVPGANLAVPLRCKYPLNHPDPALRGLNGGSCKTENNVQPEIELSEAGRPPLVCAQELQDPAINSSNFCGCTNLQDGRCKETILARNFLSMPLKQPLIINSGGFAITNVPFHSNVIVTPTSRPGGIQYRFEWRSNPNAPAQSFYREDGFEGQEADLIFRAIPLATCTAPNADFTVATEVCANSTSLPAEVPNPTNGASYIWEITNGAIESGQGTGKITWRPTGSDPVTLKVTASTGEACKTDTTKTVTVKPSPSITTTTLPNGTRNKPYSQKVEASGGTGNYSYRHSAGTLPTGLTLNSSTGVLEGTPTTIETYRFTVAVKAGDCESSQQYTVQILPLVYEADVQPSPNGDGQIDILDYQRLGTVLEGTRPAFTGGEFRRADCHPRASLGDGVFDVLDMQQAGRYLIQLDPLTEVGGPDRPQTLSAFFDYRLNPFEPIIAALLEPAQAQRTVRLGAGQVNSQNKTVSVPLEIVALGGEFGISLSLSYDKNVLSEPVLSAGSSSPATATLLLNTTQTGAGKVGVIFLFPFSNQQGFAAGTHQYAVVTFKINSNVTAATSTIEFDESPTPRRVSDVNLNDLTASTAFTPGQVPLRACPTVTSINPMSGLVGSSVTINGSGFTGVTEVRFANDVFANSTVVSDTQITTTVPPGAVSGPITLRKANCDQVTTSSFTVTACSYAIAPLNANFNAAGNTGNVSVTASSGCTWTAVSRAPWLTITSNPNGNGNGTVSYSVAANSGPARSGTLTIAEQTFNVTQASGCTFALTPASQSFQAAGGNGSVNVTAGAGCEWMATSQAGWLTINSGAPGNGNGQVAYTVAPNNGPTRSGTLTIADQTFTVNQDAGCNYTISPTSQTVPASGGANTVNVTTVTGCPWTAQSDADWLTFTSNPNNTGSGVVSYTVAPNPLVVQRTGRLMVAGQTLTVTQAGINCTYSIAPTNASYDASGGANTVQVTAPSGCAWTATSEPSASWLTITSNPNGNGNGAVNYSVAANPSANQRTGTLTVAGQTVTVTQTGVGCTFTVAPTNANFLAAGGTNNVTVTAPAGCQWTATTNNTTWITLNSGNSGNGNGVVNYSVAANSGPARSGTLTIAGQSFTVTQDSGCALALTTVALPNGTLGVNYAPVTLLASNGTGALAWSVSASALPAGLNLNAQSGVISGVPAAPGRQTFTIKVVDALGCQAARELTIVIDCPPITISPAELPAAAMGQNYFVQLSQTGGSGAITWRVSAGTLPNNLSLNPSTGLLNGTPTAAGTSSFTIRATDAQGCFGERAYTLVVNLGCPAITLAPTALPNGQGGAPYNQTLTATGGTAPYVFALSSGSLPNGLSLSASGLISGTPLATGNFSFTVRATDNKGCSGTRDYTLVTNCNFTLSRSSQDFSATGGNGSVNVATTTGCTWTATSNVAWLNLTSGSSGNGNGIVIFSVAANTGTTRSGTLTIAGQTFTVTQQGQTSEVVTLSAASYRPNAPLAPDSIVAAFGANLATQVVSASSLPLPTTLAGTTVRVIDSAGVERLAPLFFVAPTQINYLIPTGTINGTATVRITTAAGRVALGSLPIARVGPGLFSANANGQGVPAGIALRIAANGAQSFEPLARFDATVGGFVAAPLDLGPVGEQLILVLFGTGFRGQRGISTVSVTLGGTEVRVPFAGAQGDLAGLDQLNLGPLPRSLSGRGNLDLVLTVEGQAANTVQVQIK